MQAKKLNITPFISHYRECFWRSLNT